MPEQKVRRINTATAYEWRQLTAGRIVYIVQDPQRVHSPHMWAVVLEDEAAGLPQQFLACSKTLRGARAELAKIMAHRVVALL